MISLIIRNPGLRKISVIKSVRSFTGLNLKSAKDLVDSAPVDLIPACMKPPSAESACRCAEELRAAGATVEGPGVEAEAMALMDEHGNYSILGWNRDKQTSEKDWKEGIQLDDLFMNSDSLHGKMQWVRLRFILPLIPPTPTSLGSVVQASAAPIPIESAAESLTIYLKSLGIDVDCVQGTCNNTDLIAVVGSVRDLPPEAPLFWEERVVKYQSLTSAESQ